jgi:hypothetical protein
MLQLDLHAMGFTTSGYLTVETSHTVSAAMPLGYSVEGFFHLFFLSLNSLHGNSLVENDG